MISKRMPDRYATGVGKLNKMYCDTCQSILVQNANIIDVSGNKLNKTVFK